MLGEEQERWLCDGLAASPATWNVLAQQVMMARVDQTGGEKESYSMDQWPGYEASRRRLLNYFGERRIANPVVLTGDIHSNWANNLSNDFESPDGPVVATEFVGTSISSGGDGVANPSRKEHVLAENPCVKFHNAQRGYVTCSVTAKRWQSDFRVVPYVERPGSPVETAGSFVVEAGEAGVKPT
jgi:alkaline phosphatase D